MRKLMSSLFVVAALFSITVPALAQDEPAPDAGGDPAEIIAELTEALALTEEQVPQVTQVFEGFLVAMETATTVPEGVEPDTQKMIGDIKKARSEFKKGMQGALNEEQFAQFEAMVDAIFQETFEDIAEIRIIDLEPVLDLTDEQSQALIPVMGTAIRDLVATLFEYGDKRMNTRTKIKLGKSVKRIQGDMEKGMSEILSPEQMEKYKAYVEAQKG